ncbi:unnamed protein product [Aphanomyces euteiches]
MSDNDDEETVLAISCMMVFVSNYLQAIFGEYASNTRFVRPDLSYMKFLSIQEQILHDHGSRIVFDTFRMGCKELDLLVALCDEFIGPKLTTKDVICITLHWLATGCSVRAQEQFFLDKSFSQIHMYRLTGLRTV